MTAAGKAEKAAERHKVCQAPSLLPLVRTEWQERSQIAVSFTAEADSQQIGLQSTVGISMMMA